MKIDFPEGSPGIHPPTAALAKILKFKQVRNPYTNAPYSEALLLGIGGGLDAGYILFKFPHLLNPLIVLGFRNQWNQTQAFLTTLTDRLNLSVRFQEFETEKNAQEALQKTLNENKLAIVWVDKAFLPYHHLPPSLKGYINHQVTVYARDGRLWRLYLDDLSSQPLEVREKTFTAARANLSQNNFLMMVYENDRDLNVQELRGVIIQGIRDCATQLTNPIRTIGISNLETWSTKLTDRHDHMGWPQVFQHQKGLFPVLRTVYESIKLNGTGGFGLRKTYADFLHEAASILSNPSLNAVAGQYLQLSNHWSILADNALPSKISDFDWVKSLLNKRYAAYREHDLKTCKKVVDDLSALEAKIINNFPLNDRETEQLYNKLSNQIKLISELEMSAAYRLRDITHR
jgi:hypothetical protein